VEELSQVLVLLLVIALAVVAITGGRPGLRQWWRSKFLGKTPA
jgi:hypothetical protein